MPNVRFARRVITSGVALLGGGAFAKPGEFPLAHHGGPFLDELPDFQRSVLEMMRRPLEDGNVTIARAAGTFNYPARFTLVASMNPCPCGMRGTRDADCRCDDAIVAKYVAKLSGPLLDRVDLQIEVGRITIDEMHAAPQADFIGNSAPRRRCARPACACLRSDAARGTHDRRSRRQRGHQARTHRRSIWTQASDGSLAYPFTQAGSKARNSSVISWF